MAMAKESSEENDPKIPVLSVLKRGIVLKNIFLNAPPPQSEPMEEPYERGGASAAEEEELILIGRHPDCHIVLDHPSISRFHLEIRAKPSIRKLTITDRSSVHGTSISGNKIPPNVPVELVEGDSEEIGQQMMSDQSGLWVSEVPSAPPMPEHMNFSSPLLESVNSLIMDVEKRTPEMESNLDPAAKRERSSLLSRRSKSKSVGFLRVDTGRSKERMGNLSFDSEAVEVGNEKENSPTYEKCDNEEKICRVLFDNLDGKDQEDEEEVTFASDEENADVKFTVSTLNSEEDELWSDNENSTPEVFKEHKPDKSISNNSVQREEVLFGSDKENITPQISSSNKLKKEQKRTKKLFANAAEDVFHSDKENWTPEPQKDMKSKRHTVDEFYSGKENLAPVSTGVKKSREPMSSSHARIEREITNRRKERIPFQILLENSPSRKSISADIERENMNKKVERIPFEPLYENSPLRKSNSEPILESSPLRKSNFADTAQGDVSNWNLSNVNYVHSLEDEYNNFPIQFKSQVPHKSEEDKKVWNMVVDTSCFLDEELRRSLKLLEGLKGTHLIIPRIVIRELDCMKRHESFFRRPSSKASSALQWIEECMENTSWWLHVQSSLETKPVAPTPPITPTSQFIDGNNELGTKIFSSMPFSRYGNFMDIVSPTAEDHILDCALLFKEIRKDGQLIILSSSTTLKIKAMAEGLLCESPKEFRESLVNPYSKRKTAKTDEAVRGLKLILLHNSHYGQTNSVK
ncbi:FHA domain-containing protein PS1 [Ananas comosus]|uniref:FHA domain-containing protein PS1 n=1 Tax=Ananas comosus TaxID=4615 RepID=A0A199VQU2_ANACO|nr:FHA domain-containing protein PS1 [Ananas comosus]